jgi:membrane protease YdiL (CAAX protease family)
MTAIAAPFAHRQSARLGPWGQAALLCIGIASIAVARWAGTRGGLDALAVGATFGVGLLLLAWLGAGDPSRSIGRAMRIDRRRLERVSVAGASATGAVVAGTAVGLGLVAIGLVGPVAAGIEPIRGLGRPDAPMPVWAVVTVLVAFAEEAVLRGVLFDRLARAGGIAIALGITTVAFALLHVPLYGWHVMPLDLAAGLVLGGLRVATRSVAAPAIAHAVADLATWWL